MLSGLQGLNMSLAYNAKFQQKVPILNPEGKQSYTTDGNPEYKWVFPTISIPMGGLRSTGLMLTLDSRSVSNEYRAVYNRLFC